jgi:hypothetical protein
MKIPNRECNSNAQYILLAHPVAYLIVVLHVDILRRMNCRVEFSNGRKCVSQELPMFLACLGLSTVRAPIYYFSSSIPTRSRYQFKYEKKYRRRGMGKCFKRNEPQTIR